MELKPPQRTVSATLCDLREEFLSHFAGKAFSTFEAFNKELQTFEETTGTQYMTKRTCLFNEGTLGREYLTYRYIHYACVRHIRPANKVGQRAGGTRCQAYFSVGTRKHKLFVRHYDMQHNHPTHMDPMVDVAPSSLPPSPLPFAPPPFSVVENNIAVQDSTEDFLRIFHTLAFDSFAELQVKMDEFQLVTGNRYVKTNTRRLPPGSTDAETLVYSHLVYICYRYGNQVSEAKQRRLQRTAKIGCRSKVYFYSQDNQLHVRRYDFRHNHEVRPDLVQFPPKRRRTRKEKEEEEEVAAAVASSTTAATPPSITAKCEYRTRTAPYSFIRSTPTLNSTSGKVDYDVNEKDVDNDDYDGVDRSELYLQPNEYEHQHFLEDGVRSMFPMHDFEILLPPQQPIDAGGFFGLSSGPYPIYSGGLPQRQAMEFSAGAMVSSERCDFETEEDTAVGSPKSLPLENLEVVLPPHLGLQLQNLGELASSCEPVLFASRLKELKALGEKWMRENEASMHNGRGFI